jgi:hypothetical protein
MDTAYAYIKDKGIYAKYCSGGEEKYLSLLTEMTLSEIDAAIEIWQLEFGNEQLDYDWLHEWDIYAEINLADLSELDIIAIEQGIVDLFFSNKVSEVLAPYKD